MIERLGAGARHSSITLWSYPQVTNALERIIVDLKNRGYELRGLTEEMVSYDFWDKNLQSIKQ